MAELPTSVVEAIHAAVTRAWVERSRTTERMLRVAVSLQDVDMIPRLQVVDQEGAAGPAVASDLTPGWAG